MKTLAVVLAMAGAAWAQSTPEERAERRASGLRDRLELTNEQYEKVKEAYIAEETGRQKLEDERVSSVKEALGDKGEQYEQLRQNFRGGRGGRGGAPGGGRGGFGGFGGFGGNPMEQMKTELGLSDEQVGKIQPIVDGFTEGIRERFNEFRQNGFQGVDWRAEMTKMREQVEELSGKVREHLTDEQKTKYDELFEQRMSMFRRFTGGGNRGGTPTPGGRGGRFGGSTEDRVRRAVEALKIDNEDERAAIAALVTKVLEARSALRDQERSAREKLGEVRSDDKLSDDAVKSSLGEVRGEREKLEGELSAARKALTEVLTHRQELELVLQGILE